jgi:uncharacterized damage-inducible protein DinB
MSNAPEVWMRGAVAGVDPLLQPVAHAFMQVKEDLAQLAASVHADDVWTRPGEAASIGFHARHIGGATDRLLTYAKGESLTPEQFAAFKAENVSGAPLADVVSATLDLLDRALEQVAATPPDALLEPRKVGRAGFPTTTLGLLFHAAEHATRHAGQALTTAKILRGTRQP